MNSKSCIGSLVRTCVLVTVLTSRRGAWFLLVAGTVAMSAPVSAFHTLSSPSPLDANTLPDGSSFKL